MRKFLDQRATACLLALVMVALAGARLSSAPTEDLSSSETQPAAAARFYPFGWFDGLDGAPRLAGMRSVGMNAVMPYAGDSSLNLSNYLQEAARRRMKVFVEVDRVAVGTVNPAHVRAFIEMYKSNPAIAGWLLADEPRLDPDYELLTPGMAKMLYDEIKRADPRRPVAIVFGVQEDPRPYKPAMDILMYDDYVQGYGKPEFFALWGWRNRLEQRAAMASGLDGYVPVLQGFGTDAAGRPQDGKRLPTTRELRYITYAAIQHKATGIMYFARFRARTWWVDKVLNPLAKEVAPAVNAFSGKSVWGTGIGYGKNMRATLFRDPTNGVMYLVVVNHGSVTTKAQIKVNTALKWKKAWSRTGGGYYIDDGHFERTFAPYEAHMYRLYR